MAAQSPVLVGVRPEGMPEAPQLELKIDRSKASAMGVSFADINSALSTALGSAYVNDFPNRGRQQRVIASGEAHLRDRLIQADKRAFLGGELLVT